MLRNLTVFFAAAVLFNITSASAQDAPVTDCDKLAANPIDPKHKAVGVAPDKIDANMAIPACEDAVRQNPNEARLIYQLGRAYFAAKNYKAAFDQFKKAADQGYAGAQTNLGIMYQTGTGVSQDYAQALNWYHKAADQGYAGAQNNLGIMYESGRGVSQDYREAMNWYRKAAEQGNEFAKQRIAGLASVDLDAKRDPNDVVAQVLNYSSFGKDNGAGGSYWYQDKSDKCRYKLFSQFTPRTIDLNALDPRTITFQHQAWSGCIMNCGASIPQPDWARNAPNGYQPQYGSGVRTIIQHDADVLFQTDGELNLERLQRGWTLIYSKYCKGKEKAF